MNHSQTHVVHMMIQSAENIIKILYKAQTWASENNLDESDLISAKLAPDMFPLSKQIQIISDNLKGMVARLSMTEPPVMEDSETTLSELIQRLEKTVQYAKSVDSSLLASSEDQKIILPFIPTKFLETPDYIFSFAIPNFYFHVTAAYCIIRHLDIPLTKMEYIGNINLQDLN